jgi:hypothetical protein
MKDKFELISAGPITLSNDDCSIELKGGKITLKAASQITLVCGDASITLQKSGAVEISGSQKVALSGGQGALELSSSGATMSGPKATVSGAGSTEITAPVVKIN